MQMIHNTIYKVKVVKIESNGFHVRADDWSADSKAAFVRRVQYDAVQSNLQVGQYVYAKLVKISVTYGMSVASNVVSQANGANMDANHHASRTLPEVYSQVVSLQRQVKELSQRYSKGRHLLDKHEKIAAKEIAGLKQQLRTVEKDKDKQILQLVSSAKQMAKEISLKFIAKPRAEQQNIKLMDLNAQQSKEIHCLQKKVKALEVRNQMAAEEMSGLKQQLGTVHKEYAKLNRQKLQLASSAQQKATEISFYNQQNIKLVDLNAQ